MLVIKIAVKCILQEKNKILLLKESAQSSWKPGKWGLPGGKIDPQEDYIQTLHREMQEETGLSIKIKGLFRIEELVEQLGNEYRLVHHYIFVVKKISGQLKEPDHHVAKLAWFTQEELKKLSLHDYTEYYYKDLLTDFIKSPKILPLSIIKIRNTQNDKNFVEWLET